MGQHPYISMKNGDTVVIAARCIPGNEEPIRNLLARLKRQNVAIILNTGEGSRLGLDFAVRERPVHVSGHEHIEGLCLAAEIIHPNVVVPIHAPPDRIDLFERKLGVFRIDSRLKRLEVGETLTV